MGLDIDLHVLKPLNRLTIDKNIQIVKKKEKDPKIPLLMAFSVFVILFHFNNRVMDGIETTYVCKQHDEEYNRKNVDSHFDSFLLLSFS